MRYIANIIRYAINIVVLLYIIDAIRHTFNKYIRHLNHENSHFVKQNNTFSSNKLKKLARISYNKIIVKYKEIIILDNLNKILFLTFLLVFLGLNIKIELPYIQHKYLAVIFILFLYYWVFLYAKGFLRSSKTSLDKSLTIIYLIFVLFSFAFTLMPIFIKPFHPYLLSLTNLIFVTFIMCLILIYALKVSDNWIYRVVAIGIVTLLDIFLIGFTFGLIYLGESKEFRLFKGEELTWLSTGPFNWIKAFDLTFKGCQPFLQNMPDELTQKIYGRIIDFMPYVEQIYGFLFSIIILGFFISKVSEPNHKDDQ